MLISGQKYAQVKDRVAEFHKMYPNGSIQKDRVLEDGILTITARVYPDINKSGRLFNRSKRKYISNKNKL